MANMGGNNMHASRVAFLILLFVLFPFVALAQVDLAPPSTMEWVVGNAADLLAIVGGLVVVAGIVARLTPTSKDDEIVGWLQKALDYWSPGGINKGLAK